MSSKQELLIDILEFSPDVLMFGEQHLAASSFRPMVFELLTKLRQHGFDVLALEIYPEHETLLMSYCNEQLDYNALQRKLPDEMKDERIFGPAYFDAARAWHRDGGKFIFINSPDPEGEDLVNTVGRDELMCNQIADATLIGRTVALVGQWHTFVRVDPTRHAGFIAQEQISHVHWSTPEELNCAPIEPGSRSYTYETVAEKLCKKGIAVYSVAEIFVQEDAILRDSVQQGIVLRRDFPTILSKCRLRNQRVGGGAPPFPELKLQYYNVSFDAWNAVYMNNEDLHAQFAPSLHMP